MLADQPLARVHRVAAAAEPVAVLSPSNTNTVWLAPDAVSACASVSNGALDVPALPAALLL